MSTVRLCSECGSPVSESSRDGFCPRCLIGLALDAEAKTGIVPPRENESPNAVGRVFGNYELLEQIGQGGMGVVYKARQRTLNRVVALKLTLAGAQATAAEIKRFNTEAKAAATLQHPNVVAIHEVGEHEGQHYFSMDYIEGKSLADVIRRTPLPAERAARYVKIIAEAIHYAHQRGILHRDLKPHNVLIDAKDEPRITDFGLARQIEVDSDLTVSGLALGTPSYMPPEQAGGRRKEIGPANDVYSLGAILYDLLTGRPPFRADTPLETLRQVIDTEPAAPRLLNRKVPRDLETVCLKCLAKLPGQRYSSAQELADDLGRFLRNEPIQARPVGRVGRLWRWGRRNPTVGGLVGATGVLLLMMATAAVLFRFDTLKSNEHVARIAATAINGELLRLRKNVEEEVNDPHLRAAALKNDREALTDLLQQAHERYGTNVANEIRIEYWMFLGTNGQMLARWPGARLPYDFWLRDYVQGALRAARQGDERAKVSRVYQSVIDGFYKFGVSKIVRDANRTPVGVMAAMVGTESTEGKLALTAPGRNTVVVGQFDPSPPHSRANTPPDFVITLHPSFHARDPAVPIQHPLLKSLSVAQPGKPTIGHDGSYRDPVGRQDRRYVGRWLAGFARVPDTPFIVIYQTRDRVIDALVTALLLTALATLCFLGWRLLRARANGRNLEDEK